MMLDWNQYREELLTAIGDLGRLSLGHASEYCDANPAWIAPMVRKLASRSLATLERSGHRSSWRGTICRHCTTKLYRDIHARAVRMAAHVPSSLCSTNHAARR